MYDVIILGCGVVGAAAAYHLARYPLDAAVLEAQNDVANGTTKANSAIIHAGYDPEPGTLMAQLNVEGNRMAGDICQKLQVPFARVGSLVLAFDEGDLHTLRTLYHRGVQNGVPGLELLDAAQVRQKEPNLSENVVGALYAPTAGIVDPWQYALAMAEVAVVNGVTLHRSAPATAITPASVTSSFYRHTKQFLHACMVIPPHLHGLWSALEWSKPDACMVRLVANACILQTRRNR